MRKPGTVGILKWGYDLLELGRDSIHACASLVVNREFAENPSIDGGKDMRTGLQVLQF